MKKILFIFISIILFLTTLNAIQVSGNQSGTWSPSNNPYEIVGNISIPGADSLEIEAGVEIFSQGNYKITAEGYILANGTINDSIYFTVDTGTNYWGGIRLENEIAQSNFSYCRISNTNDMNDYGIQSVASPVIVENCTLDNHKKAVSFSGLSSDDPPYMEISNSKIINCEQNGILITDNSNALVHNCEITQCGLGTQYRGAIQLGLQSSAHDCSPTITNNNIHNNGKQGMILGNMFNYQEMAPTVENNEVYNNLTGIYLYNAKGNYHNNHVYNNFISNDPNSGAGFMLYGSGAYGVFTENHVHNNYTGFFLDNNAGANLGDIGNFNNSDNGLNMIHDNVFFDGTVFSVVNNSAEDVKAENNIWDHIADHDSTIVDGNDNNSYGLVDYEPYLTPFPAPDSNSCYYDNGEIVFNTPTVPTYLYIDSVFIEITALGYYNSWWINFTSGCTLILDMLNPAFYSANVSYLYETGDMSQNYSFNFTISQSVPANAQKQLFTIAPNPFKGSTEIILSQKIAQKIQEIQIYNIRGQKVKSLPVSPSPSRTVSVVWDGKNSNSVKQKIGIYFCKIGLQNQIIYRKIMKW